MRVCQFRHFGNEVRQRTTRRGRRELLFYCSGIGNPVKLVLALQPSRGEGMATPMDALAPARQRAQIPSILPGLCFASALFSRMKLTPCFQHDIILFSLSGGSNSVVECDLAKVEVAGSNPVSRSIHIFNGNL